MGTAKAFFEGRPAAEKAQVTTADNPRYLRFGNVMQRPDPIHASCSRCDKGFIGRYRSPNERTDEVLMRMRAEFEAHDCEGPPTKN